MQILPPIEVYKLLRDNYKTILIQENPEITDDQLSRKANIYAVKNTWFYYNTQHKILLNPIPNLKLTRTVKESTIIGKRR